MFFIQSETAADHGQFSQARELTRRAADSARRAQEKETAAEYEGQFLREGWSEWDLLKKTHSLL
jgi:hypothetical protein